MKLTSSNGRNTGKTRAEETRQRRAASSEPRPTRASNVRKAATRQTTARTTRNVVVPAHRQERITPGVIVRGMGLGTPVAHKARNKGRRQYYYSLGTTGAEVRLPSVPMVNPGWRILSALLVLALFAGIWLAYNNPMFQINSLEITGIDRLKDSEILNVVDVSNKPVFTVNPQEIKAALETTFPELTDVQVSVALPATVAISAVERHPAILWKSGESTYWVDPEGYIFEPREGVEGLIVIESDALPPVVRPVSLEEPAEAAEADVEITRDSRLAAESSSVLRQQMDSVVVKAALGLSEIIPAGTTLTYSQQNGMGWADNRGWNVFVGVDLEQIDQKMKVYEAVVNKLSQEGITPVMISVENVHAPFYRMEQ